MICSSSWSRQVCAEPRKYCVSLDLFIYTPLIYLEDRELSGGEEVSPRGSEDDCSTDGGEEVPRSTARHEKGKVSYTRKDKGKRKQRESTPKLKCFLCDGPHLTRECPKRKALSTLIEKSEKTMEDARLGSIQMIGALQVMLEVVGQFGLYYSEQTQGILRSLVATLSLLSRVIES